VPSTAKLPTGATSEECLKQYNKHWLLVSLQIGYMTVSSSEVHFLSVSTSLAPLEIWTLRMHTESTPPSREGLNYGRSFQLVRETEPEGAWVKAGLILGSGLRDSWLKAKTWPSVPAQKCKLNTNSMKVLTWSTLLALKQSLLGFCSFCYRHLQTNNKQTLVHCPLGKEQ
jgi:hypothetical protein